jgi:predicted NAD/FAD-dependent oxidoreductase
MMRVVIVGAGLSGLVAANELQAAGVEVAVVDKARSPGGRLATRRIGGATLDHGAQFFTVRTPAFQHRCRSKAHWQRDTADLRALLVGLAAPWLGEAAISVAHVKKWRFATPRTSWPDPCWESADGGVLLAGDALDGPRIEAAHNSGLAAAYSTCRARWGKLHSGGKAAYRTRGGSGSSGGAGSEGRAGVGARVPSGTVSTRVRWLVITCSRDPSAAASR